MDRSAANHRQLYRLLFEHGIHTLLTSLFGASLLQRGDTYVSIGLNYGLTQIARDAGFRQLFDELGVRVRFYGDYRRVFPQLGYGHLLDLLDEVTEATALTIVICCSMASALMTRWIPSLGSRSSISRSMAARRRDRSWWRSTMASQSSRWISLSALTSFACSTCRCSPQATRISISRSAHRPIFPRGNSG